MFSDIDDITINYEEEGIQVVRELDRVVQFERFGFVRIDSAGEKEVVAYFAHE